MITVRDAELTVISSARRLSAQLNRNGPTWYARVELADAIRALDRAASEGSTT